MPFIYVKTARILITVEELVLSELSLMLDMIVEYIVVLGKSAPLSHLHMLQRLLINPPPNLN